MEKFQQTRWTLRELLPFHAGPAVEDAFSELEAATLTVEAVKPLLSPQMSEEDFLKVLKAAERFAEAAHRLGSYSQLWFSEDTQNQAALAFLARTEHLLTDANNRILFFSLWWKGLEDAAAERLYSCAGELRYYLEQLRLFKRHTLTEPEEKIVNLKDLNGVNAMVKLYDVITNRFTFTLAVDGQEKQVNRDELMVYVRHASPQVREAAYKEQFRVFREESTVLSQIYLHRVKDWASENVGLRHFSSPMAVRNLGNDIPDKVVDTLLSVCGEQSHVFQRYFKLKAGWLGLEEGKLRRYDLYAPISQKTTRNIAYHDAVVKVIECFDQFSPVMAAHARRVFDDGHIDAEIRPGKRGGAFCAGVFPGVTPWVLLNYTGEPRQVATLAHELGHAVHALLAGEHSILTFHSSLPMAETASVFGEMLLMDRLLAEEDAPDVRRDILGEAIDNIYATVMRQAFIVLFEREAHRMIEEGVTMEDLNMRYLSHLADQFGDSMVVSDDFQYEWITIPHIYHTPFYCYAYSFGQLLSLSLYQRYREEGRDFVPRFLKILAYGGSSSAQDILGEARIDIADPDFWRSGFRVIERMIDELR
jgi:oligoendopeptidase F